MASYVFNLGEVRSRVSTFERYGRVIYKQLARTTTSGQSSSGGLPASRLVEYLNKVRAVILKRPERSSVAGTITMYGTPDLLIMGRELESYIRVAAESTEVQE